MKRGGLPSTKKLIAKEIASMVKKPYVEKPKTKSPSIQSSKFTKPKSVTKVSLKGGALPSTKKFIAEKIASLVKKPSTRKPKSKSPSIQSSKCPKPKCVTKVSMKGGALPSTKKLTTKKIASLVKKLSAGKPKINFLQSNLQNAPYQRV